jgi:hypothetical protein
MSARLEAIAKAVAETLGLTHVFRDCFSSRDFKDGLKQERLKSLGNN